MKNNKVTTGTAVLKECGQEELVVETLYSAISPGTELRMLGGHYGAAGKFPYVPGYNSIARIVAVGEKAEGWRVGDLVPNVEVSSLTRLDDNGITAARPRIDPYGNASFN